MSPLVDPGTSHDPIGVATQPAEVGIGDDLVGNAAACTGNPKPNGAAEA